MKRLISLMLFALVASSCNAGSFGDKSSTNNKSKADDKPRPSEQGEGVVGYLVDPNQVRYTEDGGKTTVSGDPGAVEFAGEAKSYEACLQELSEDALNAIVDGGSAFSADVKGRGEVNEDGSFSITMDGAPTGVLAVNVSGFCDSLAPVGFVGTGTSVVFRRPGNDSFEKGGGFGNIAESTADTLSLCSDEETCPYQASFRFENRADGTELKGPATVDFHVSTCEAGVTECDAYKLLTTLSVDGYQLVQFSDQNYLVDATFDNNSVVSQRISLSQLDDGKVLTLKFTP